MATGVARDENYQRRDQQPANCRDQQNTVPGQVGQHIKRQISRTDREPLRESNKFGKDNGSTAGNCTDGASQGNEREGLDLIELLAETLESGLSGGVRSKLLSVLRTERKQ
jgi:hypothetical protein